MKNVSAGLALLLIPACGSAEVVSFTAIVEPPLEYESGEPLQALELLHYRLYYDTGRQNGAIEWAGTPTHEFTLDLPNGEHAIEFAVTASIWPDAGYGESKATEKFAVAVGDPLPVEDATGTVLIDVTMDCDCEVKVIVNKAPYEAPAP